MNKLLISTIYIFSFLVYKCGNAQVLEVQKDTVYNGETVSSDWVDYGIVVGGNFSKNLYGEINYYKSSVWEVGGFPLTSTTTNYGLEFSYFDDFVIAPKIQGRYHAYMFNVSLTALWYTDLKKEGALKIRPEIGLGLWNIDINYGYNIGVYKNGFEKHNRHLVTLRYYFKLHRKYLNEYDVNGNIRPK